jgi:hypothetical protein
MVSKLNTYNEMMLWSRLLLKQSSHIKIALKKVGRLYVVVMMLLCLSSQWGGRTATGDVNVNFYIF